MNDEMRYRKIAEANSRAEAEVIGSFLRAEGIDVVVMPRSGSESGYPVAMGAFEIYVAADQVTLARMWLENSQEEKGEKK